MMYPKPGKHKKRKKHKQSILQEKDGRCYLCMRLDNNYQIYTGIQEHHVFGGANRDISEAEGLKVYLCLEHHTAGKAAVHNNHENMQIVREDAQRAEFITLMGKNYLIDGGNDE